MNTTKGILPVLGAAAGLMILAFGVALTASCRGSDQVAPEGAIISLAANPAAVLTGGDPVPVDVVATVMSSVGVPQEDQDVRFSNSAGTLRTPFPDDQPAANIPISTDNLGNAHVVLLSTTSTTINARSGTATASLTLSTQPGNLSIISLSQVQGPGCMNDPNFVTCDDALCLEAEATDTEGKGVSNLQVVFQLTNIVTDDPTKPFNGTFTPRNTVSTNSSGIARVSFSIGDSTCIDVCGDLKTCTGTIVVSLQGGSFLSNPVPFTSGIQ